MVGIPACRQAGNRRLTLPTRLAVGTPTSLQNINRASGLTMPARRNFEPPVRIELTTYSLPRSCSATELGWHLM